VVLPSPLAKIRTARDPSLSAYFFALIHTGEKRTQHRGGVWSRQGERVSAHSGMDARNFFGCRFPAHCPGNPEWPEKKNDRSWPAMVATSPKPFVWVVKSCVAAGTGQTLPAMQAVPWRIGGRTGKNNCRDHVLLFRLTKRKHDEEKFRPEQAGFFTNGP